MFASHPRGAFATLSPLSIAKIIVDYISASERTRFIS